MMKNEEVVEYIEKAIMRSTLRGAVIGMLIACASVAFSALVKIIMGWN